LDSYVRNFNSAHCVRRRSASAGELRYVVNIFKARAVKDVDEVTRTIPVVDIGPAVRCEPGGLERVAAGVRRASEHIAFFYIAGHGVLQATIDAAFAASREFDAMPLAEKLALRINENNIGYRPVKKVSGRLEGPQGDSTELQRELLHQPRSQSR
jgi:hypothetical protein